MNKLEIAAALEEAADLMEILGENPFRVRSFRKGARTIEGLEEDLAARAEAGTLAELSGIGKTLAGIITELVSAGVSTALEELREAVHPGLLSLVSVPGVGPKKARVIHEQLGIASLEALESACQEGKIARLSGFGPKTQEKILAGIAYRRQVQGRFLIIEAMVAAEALLDFLKGDEAVERVEVAGSLRRWRETVKDIDIIIGIRNVQDQERVSKRFLSWDGLEEVVAAGETKYSARLHGGLPVDIRIVDNVAFPFALQYFTGSKEHNTALRGLARERGLKLNEYGLYKDTESGESISCQDERAIYRELGLDWIPPELREDRGEIELARQHRLPDLVQLEDLRGIVHVHTSYSDGKQTVEEMVEAARNLGFEYLGISDHSQSAGYAGGLKEEAVRRQHEEIDRLNASHTDFRIFKGIESDIRLDGSLDYPPEVLDLFDFVIASIHSGFQLSEVEQTDRVIRALEDPHTTFLAHPTGRLLLGRDSFAIDMEKVLEAAGRLGVVVEINANPRRLDLDWRWGGFARQHGVRTAIHPDAHAAVGYRDVVFGIGIARKAGFTAAEVVNTLSAADFAKCIGSRQSH